MRHLRCKMENHLLGNHLWANAKALVFSGCFFDSAESDKWLRYGLRLVAEELEEQVLLDGGHFERSPMYHAIVLEDLLDLIQLANLYPKQIPGETVSRWRELATCMFSWLQVMTHPDGELSFFNDATLGIAPNLSALTSYRELLGLVNPSNKQVSALLGESGYARMQLGEAIVLADVAPIGPDYLPGHAHADTLSFEMSLFGQRLFVNQGIDRYGTDDKRLFQRGTAAHNTVVVDGENSSEVWSGFRVARRARPFNLFSELDSEPLTLRCAHNGYHRLSGKVTHTRQWTLTHGQLEITDFLTGKWQEAFASLHLHPDVNLLDFDQASCGFCIAGRIIRVTLDGGQLVVKDGSFHPGFGLSVPCVTLRLVFKSDSIRTRIEWTD